MPRVFGWQRTFLIENISQETPTSWGIMNDNKDRGLQASQQAANEFRDGFETCCRSSNDNHFVCGHMHHSFFLEPRRVLFVECQPAGSVIQIIFISGVAFTVLCSGVQMYYSLYPNESRYQRIWVIGVFLDRHCKAAVYAAEAIFLTHRRNCFVGQTTPSSQRRTNFPSLRCELC